jgi:hypothetical protein
LGDGLPVNQRTQFGPSAGLTSSVVPSAGISNPAVEFRDSALSVLLPVMQTRTWAHSPQVAIEATQDVGSGTQLAILVEKDFECVHSRAEGDEDAFPNPRLKNRTGATSTEMGQEQSSASDRSAK